MLFSTDCGFTEVLEFAAESPVVTFGPVFKDLLEIIRETDGRLFCTHGLNLHKDR